MVSAVMGTGVRVGLAAAAGLLPAVLLELLPQPPRATAPATIATAAATRTMRRHERVDIFIQ
jgi:hypothetical protein